MTRTERRAWARRLVAGMLALCAFAAVPSPAQASPGPPGYPQWWFDDWDVPGLWADGARGQGITIAEIDTGVNADVPELEGKVLPGRDFGDPQADGRTDQDLEEFGHGTAMASLMVAEPGDADITGLAPDARVLPVAVPLIGTATEGKARYALPLAIEWAADQGAKIISLSLGQERLEGEDPLACPTAEQDAIVHALSLGAIVVAAAGNEGEKGSPAADPGVCVGVVAVGAIDSSEEVAAFSSRHPYLTVTAPGVRIPTLSRVPGEVYIGEGTSQATAITSAGLALVWSAHPELTNDQVVARMLATLDRRATAGAPDPAYGYGTLDIGAAVRADVPLDAANPLRDAAAPFLQRSAATDPRVIGRPTVPPTAEGTDTLPGEVAVGARPTDLTTPVVQGAAVAGTGLVVLIALVVVGILKRRRYRQAVRASMPPVATLVGPAEG